VSFFAVANLLKTPNRKAALWWLGWLIIWLISFLLGETFIQWYVYATISLWLAVGCWLIPSIRISAKHAKYWWCGLGVSGGWLGWLGISSWLSLSQPMSLQAFIVWLLLLQTSWFFASRDWEVLSEQLFVGGLLSVVGVLAILSLVMVFQPRWGVAIPEMNVLYHTYGHAHFGVLLLWVNAFVLVWIHRERKLIWLMGLMWVLALVSLGRTVAGLLAIQTGILVWRWFEDRRARLMGGIVILGLISWLVFRMVLGWWVHQGHRCPVSFAYVPLCGAVIQEQRGEYWGQAWEAIKTQPWSGYGLGTFRLLSLKFSRAPYSKTSFAHQDWLELAAETGWPATLVFVGGVIGLVWWLRPKPFAPSWPTAAWIGIVTLGLNACFDFDLHFLGVSVWLVMMLGWLVVRRFTTGRAEQLHLAGVNWLNLIQVGTAGLLLVLAGLYYVTSNWTLQGQPALVMKVFPYFLWEGQLLANQRAKLTSEEQTQLQHIYGHHAEIVQTFLTAQAASSPARIQLTSQLHRLDPWSRVDFESFTALLDRQDWVAARTELIEVDNFFSFKRSSIGYEKESLPDSIKTSLAMDFMRLANHEFETHQYKSGILAMQRAHYYWEWMPHDSPYCASLVHNLEPATAGSAAELIELLQPLATIPSESFGNCRPDFAQWYRELARIKTLAGDCGVENQTCDWLLQQSAALEN
jgi:O-antigen ligase